jgi:sulfhydrogenase subunit delta
MPKAKKSLKGRKIKIAIVGLTSCEGCSFAVLDLGLDFVQAIDHFDLNDFHLIMEEKGDRKYDVTFVDGSPLTKENIKTIKELRRRSTYLVALGACACNGVIPNIKNYIDKEHAVKYQYPKMFKSVYNPNILPIRRYVPVDFEIPGCPLDANDFKIVLNALREGINPKLLENPICYECQMNGNECLLQKGEPCLGPVIRGGCNAVCLNSKFFCKGCRGILPGYPTKQLDNQLMKYISRKRLNEILQIFGIQENWYKAQE